MSEFELSLLRQRSAEAIRRKASRGELRFLLPVGLCWTAEDKIDKDPDRRVQQALELVFGKLTELGSARQVLLWLREKRIQLPSAPRDRQPSVVWKLPIYNNILSILSNPMYAGAYAFGKTEARTTVVAGRARQTAGHLKPRSEWTVLLRDHHPGYISWEQYERNQALLAANAHMKSCMEPKAGRGGRALLSGLLRCHRCGRMLHVAYGGIGGRVLRYYHCRGAHINHGADSCISFGGLRVGQALANEVLQAIGGDAVEAALEAAEQQREKQREQRRALEMEAEQARYEARLAERRYQAVDPDNRLVAAELEARWNAAMRNVAELDTKLDRFDDGLEAKPLPDKADLLSLAQDLPSVWNSPSADMRFVEGSRKQISPNQRECRRRWSSPIPTIRCAGGRSRSTPN